MDAVHWKKIQRVTPWLLPDGRPAGARVHRARRVDDRRHAVDGLHPVRRLRVGLPVDGGRPAVRRPGRARQGLPLRRRPARRPAPRSACEDLAEDPHGIYDCTHCFNCIEACPKGVAPMSQIMRLRRHRDAPTTGSTTATTATATSTRSSNIIEKYGHRSHEAELLPRLLRRQFHPRGRCPSCCQLAADRACAGCARGKVTPRKALLHPHKRRTKGRCKPDLRRGRRPKDERLRAQPLRRRRGGRRASRSSRGRSGELHEGRLLARLRVARLHAGAARLDGARSRRCSTSSWSSSTAPTAAAPA